MILVVVFVVGSVSTGQGASMLWTFTYPPTSFAGSAFVALMRRAGVCMRLLVLRRSFT